VSDVNSPHSPIHAAVTRARIERVIARLPEISEHSEELIEGIEANLFDLGELRARCSICAYLYRPYLENCPTCVRRLAKQ
jgi:hypothetical protein